MKPSCKLAFVIFLAGAMSPAMATPNRQKLHGEVTRPQIPQMPEFMRWPEFAVFRVIAA
jgi:hypothetical protein